MVALGFQPPAQIPPGDLRLMSLALRCQFPPMTGDIRQEMLARQTRWRFALLKIRLHDVEIAKLRDALGARFLTGLVLTIEGARVALAVVRSDLEFTPGVADLPTARLTLDLEAHVPAEGVLAVTFSDTNFEGRAGWKEVVAAAGKGATLLSADVPASDRTRRLTEYPSDPAEPPSEVTRAALRVRFGAGRVP